MVFYNMNRKGVSEIKFQLKDLEEKEDYIVYDKVANSVVREGSITGDDNQQYNVQETRFLKTTVFNQVFNGATPRYNRSTKRLRQLIINENNINYEYTFGFAFNASQKLATCIQTLQSMGANVAEYEFILRRQGAGLQTTYEIITGQNIGLPQNIQQAVMPASSVSPVSPVQPVQQQSIMPQPLQPAVQTGQNIPAIPQPVQSVTQPVPLPAVAPSGFSFNPSKLPVVQDVVSLNRTLVNGFDKTEGDLFDSLSQHAERFTKQRFVELWEQNIGKVGKQFELQRAELIFDKLYNM